MVNEEEFKKLPYPEQLKVLMKEAQAKKDIWLILVINDEMKKLNTPSESPLRSEK